MEATDGSPDRAFAEAFGAAAEAPASPVPTTMTVYFRLLAGLTTLMSNLWRSQAVSMGPEGALLFSVVVIALSSAQDAGQDGDGNGAVAQRDAGTDQD